MDVCSVLLLSCLYICVCAYLQMQVPLPECCLMQSVVCGPLSYCAPLVCVPPVIGVLTVWWHNQKTVFHVFEVRWCTICAWGCAPGMTWWCEGVRSGVRFWVTGGRVQLWGGRVWLGGRWEWSVVGWKVWEGTIQRVYRWRQRTWVGRKSVSRQICKNRLKRSRKQKGVGTRNSENNTFTKRNRQKKLQQNKIQVTISSG